MADTPRRQIVLCFDGTGNTFRADGTETNILKICRMLERTDEQSGIGTEITPGSLAAMTLKKSSRLGKSKTLSQALGKSFDQHVLGGYRFLMRHYRTGAEIYIFGFSRGAYTALFLANMLDHTGLLGPDNEEMIPFIWNAFSKWKLARYLGTGQRTEAYDFLRHCRETLCRPVVRARFVGLFDTVNSIADFEIYNDMSSSAVITRHAVSIDERRSKFEPVLLRPRNPNKPPAVRYHRRTKDSPPAEAPGEASNPADDPAAADVTNAENEDDDVNLCDVEEAWFPGGHADIGGGYQRAPTEKKYQLSHAPLVWMVQEASRCGLRFDPDKLRSEGCLPNPESPDEFYKDLDDSIATGQLHDRLEFGPGMSITSVLAWRIMEYLPIRRADIQPDGSWKPIHWPLHRGWCRDMRPDDVVHVSVFRRMDANPAYRPASLLAGGWNNVRKTPAEFGPGEFVIHEHEGDPVRQTYSLLNPYLYRHSSKHPSRSGRNHPVEGIQDLIGPTTLFLPVRIHLDKAQTVHDLLHSSQGFQAAMIPYEHVGWLELREMEHLKPILRHSLNMNVKPQNVVSLDWGQDLQFQSSYASCDDPFGIEVTLLEGEIEWRIYYDERFITSDTVARLLGDFTRVFKELVTATAQGRSELTVGEMMGCLLKR
ncbi:hypothetical protein CNMCM7691_009867 [Aspergillus felis]|uniref:T6SS Phospholipase effector Tle1-like catalytic domain-containing protein n=1 Tax=Aspergillus felis TaxID=1287682 RepID=A0A8H6QZ86_9EURO|nr:hypothetical protein CNMCM7691_009867 [Aspergillus felis]